MKKEHGLFRLGPTGGAARRMHGRWQREHQILTRWPSMTDCNPYEILEQPRGGPYNKRRFYELVMVYHPDRWIHGEYHGIPKSTRIERYRLILAANAILSDPVKRRAYDEHGMGWTLGGVRSHAATGRNPSQKQTAARHSSSTMNATWEDWETWRDRDYNDTHGYRHGWQTSGGQQQAVFLCNRRFALTLLLLATTGSCLMLLAVWTRAKVMSDHQLKIHETLLDELCHVGDSEVGLSRQERINLFLRRRLAIVARPKQEE
ncbi:hypothetical protein PG996_008916 [Apiospora saccharicola]|uniref:J domain-containing protein n=1 Tax=Apiospora saccharicola TaxID=335842 RepID=A0ABR1V2G9_9PEZI